MIIVRYADDIVLGFEHRRDAKRFLAAWRERLAVFGLELHPDKTRLIAFGRDAADHRKARGENKPETFDFLGFTHVCGTTRKTGRFIVKRQTIRRRFSAKLAAINEALRRRWHEPVPTRGRWLNAVVQGYFNRALRRRGQRRRLTWVRYVRLVEVWIPSARIRTRTCASTLCIQGKSRMQQFCTYGSVRGAPGQPASLPRHATA
jgi:RNA-directed DNA polymerase